MAWTDAIEDELIRLRWDHAWLKMKVALLKAEIALKAYNPHQPRIAAGNGRISGRWTEDGYSGGEVGLRAQPLQAIQLAAEITGFTRHGMNQAINRGVAPAAILDAVKNPLAVVPQSEGRTKYIGQGAVVILSSTGRVITLWKQ